MPKKPEVIDLKAQRAEIAEMKRRLEAYTIKPFTALDVTFENLEIHDKDGILKEKRRKFKKTKKEFDLENLVEDSNRRFIETEFKDKDWAKHLEFQSDLNENDERDLRTITSEVDYDDTKLFTSQLFWLFPSTYDQKSNPLRIKSLIDNTGITEFKIKAKAARFDPTGFDDSFFQGLRKDLFYLSPFLTCQACNGLAFVDVINLRKYTSKAPPEVKALLIPEILPTCPICNRTDSLRVGSDDWTHLIAENAEELKRILKLKKKMTKVIQRSYRAYLIRSWIACKVELRQIVKMLEYRCIVAIQSAMRHRLAKRRFVVEKNLKIIGKAHPIVRKWALQQRENGITCQWYNQSSEDIILKDYYLFLERAGFNPPRYFFEQNAIEFARRILIRIGWYATFIQKRWRGIVVRRLLQHFYEEKMRIRQRDIASVFKIQSMYRGWYGRVLKKKTAFKKQMAKLKGGLIFDMMQLSEKRKLHDLKTIVIENYKNERQEERSVRCTGLIHPSKGDRMRAYSDSPYGTDFLVKSTSAYSAVTSTINENDIARQKKRDARAEWLLKKKEEHFAYPIYYKEETDERRDHLIEKYTKDVSYKNVAREIRKATKAGYKYEYPSKINEDKYAILDRHYKVDLDKGY